MSNNDKLIPNKAQINSINHIEPNTAGCKIAEIITPCFKDIDPSSSFLVTAGILKLSPVGLDALEYNFSCSCVYFPSKDIVFL